MKLGYDISLKQNQKMILSQNMQQSIKVLQMSLSDLSEYIYNEFTENPVLEVKEEGFKKLKEINEEQYYEKYLNNDWDNYKDRTENSYSKDEDTSPLNFIEKKKSLKEYLYEQLVEVDEKQDIIYIAKYIIESLDSRGYLGVSVDELSKELNIKKERVLKGLKVVQALEPYGIGAANIKECLLIQSEKLNILDDKIEKMICDHLENIALNKYEVVAKDLNISPSEAQRYGDLIRGLEPKPSRGFFTGDEVKYIVPDAEVKDINGEFYIVMNEGAIPKLRVNNTYKQALMSSDAKTNKYVKEKIDKAVLLIKSIEQRKNTLYRILECIVKRQKEFFLKGRNYIKPLMLKDVAEEINLHESTISRAIKDKYVLTSFGTIKIKDFFPVALKTNNNEEMSNISIKNEIKNIINNEDKNKPLSDASISDLLNKNDIKISRRTVAKYREEMGIKSSSLRRRI